MPITLGSSLGHYEIVGSLGVGGMGEVYRAHDGKLDRDVAIKVLPEALASDFHRLARFDREAKALASLNHPNVATVHGFESHEGIRFLVMELATGETLAEQIKRGPIPVKKAISLFVQIAEGLEAAHQVRTIHRDLKPANIMVTETGRAKILDFGLAKAVKTSEGGNGQQSSTLSAALTQRGAVLGTPAYMSPEQAQGLEVDVRSDIWSFGICLFEALTGQRVFKGDSAPMVLAAVLKDEPPFETLPQETPEPVRALLRRCLTRDPNRRLQSIAEARVQLAESLAADPPSEKTTAVAPRRQSWRMGLAALAIVGMIGLLLVLSPLFQSPAEAIDSVVVMPLENRGDDSEDAYLGDGIAEQLINQLAGRDEVRVIARSTAFAYRDRGRTPQQLGNELGVRAILSGRVQRRGVELNVQIELVDTSDGAQLWGEQFDAKMADLVGLQEEINRKVLARLQPESIVNALDGGTDIPEALDLQMRGSYKRQRRTRESIEAALLDFEKATDLDPNYTQAYLGIARCYSDLRSWSLASPASVIEPWRNALDKALSLNDRSSEAWVLRAVLAYSYEWDWEAAGPMLERAIALDPRSEDAHTIYAYYLVTFAPGRALESARRAVALDPNGLYAIRTLAMAYHYLGDYEAAVVQAERGLAKDPTYYPALLSLFWTFLDSDDTERAIEVAERIRSATGGSLRSQAFMAMAEAKRENREPGERLLELLGDEPTDGSATGERQRYLSSIDQAKLLLLLGDPDGALAKLEDAVEQREFSLVYLEVNTNWDPLRLDPRFLRIAERLGIPKV